VCEVDEHQVYASDSCRFGAVEETLRQLAQRDEEVAVLKLTVQDRELQVAQASEEIERLRGKIERYRSDPYCTICGKPLPDGKGIIAQAHAKGVQKGD